MDTENGARSLLDELQIRYPLKDFTLGGIEVDDEDE